MMDQLIYSGDCVPAAKTNCITQFTLEIDIFLFEWAVIDHLKQEMGHGFKGFAKYKAVADEDVSEAQSIVWFEAATEPSFRNIE